MKARITFVITSLILFLGLSAALIVGLQGVVLASDKVSGYSHQQMKEPQAPACGPDWTAITSANATPSDIVLSGAATISAGDVWAVGFVANDGTHVRTLTEHWDGTAWSAVSNPRTGSTDDRLLGVAAASSSDVWAVGQYLNGIHDQTLIEHWNGGAWSVVSSPNQPGTENVLSAVTVASSGDVWAVGSYYNNTLSAFQTLIEHWDGATWSIVDSPNLSTFDNGLQSVAVTSSTDVWAVGYYSTGISGPHETLIERWNSTAWGIVTSPNPGANGNGLQAVAVASSSDVWAVGYQVAETDQRQTLVLHWVGQQWEVVNSPNPGNVDDDLAGLAVLTGNDIWAVGSYNGGTAAQTLVEHWDGTSWTVNSSPSQGDSLLNGVAVVSTGDVWAVGYHSNADPSQTLIEHFDGTSWTISPNADQLRNNELRGIAAVSADDVWAVGASNDGPGIDIRPLIEHWDGTAWNVITSPPDPTSAESASLNSVSAVSANDVWAVGSYYDGQALRTLIEHWNGTAWSVAGSPNETTADNNLQGVAAVNSTDVWAVGYFTNASNYHETLAEYWNGTDWTIISTPNVGTGDNALYGAAAYTAFDVWAVGYYKGPSGNQTLIEHWNGFTWSLKNSPNTGTGDNFLMAVSAIASTNAWAVGYYDNEGLKEALIEHWSASGWTVVNSPPVGGWDNYLLGVAAVSSSEAWAVGYDDNGTEKQTLIEHWNGSTWSVASSPNGGTSDNYLRAVASTSASDIWAVGNYSNDTGTGTLAEHYTPCSPTATPTSVATPTSCAITFIDVPPGSTFYSYIRCLACQGIISGYSDGTFKPGNNVTRGQLSKIVSNAAGFNDPQTDQLFQDIPPDSDFFTYTARLASRGLISGYACGLPIEPCGPAHLPYFRPYNQASRGQIAKIDSNAAGFSDTPWGQWFQDVPVGSTYYTYTYRLASRSYLIGYPCSYMPAEPCVPPDYLPYLRPNANATRGQTSKIVANTFFPDCNPPSRP